MWQLHPQRPPRRFIEIIQKERRKDILEGIAKIQRYTSGLNAQTFRENEMVVDAVIRNLEFIGEASRNIPW